MENNQSVKEDLVIPATDEFSIHATIFTSQKSNTQIKPVLVIVAPAAACKRTYYFPYCEYLSSLGHVAITFDYRGVGDSAPKNLKGFQASFSDWGLKDVAGVIEWCSTNYPSHTLCYIGHSIGGHLSGTPWNKHKISRVITVATLNAYYGNSRHPWAYYFFWNYFFMFFMTLFGYFPGKMLHLFEDIPYGVAYQWRQWAMHPFYLCSVPELRERLANFEVPMLSYSIYAPFDAAYSFHQFFKRADITYVHISPSDVNAKFIGHMGFFNSQFQDNLWKDTARFFEGGQTSFKTQQVLKAKL